MNIAHQWEGRSERMLPAEWFHQKWR